MKKRDKWSCGRRKIQPFIHEVLSLVLYMYPIGLKTQVYLFTMKGGINVSFCDALRIASKVH